MLISSSSLRSDRLRSRRATVRRTLVPAVVTLALASGLMTATPGTTPAAAEEVATPTERVLLAGLSSATSNTYQEPDGMRTLESFTAPVNYQDEQGEWQPIDNTFVDVPGSAYAVENAANAYSAQIPADASTTPVKFTVGNQWVTMRLHGADSAPVVEDNEVTFMR